MPNTTYDYGDLRVTLTTNYQWRWDDSGSGNSIDVSLWHPSPQGNLRALGSICDNKYFDNVNGKRATLLVGPNPNTSPSKPAVVNPTGYTATNTIMIVNPVAQLSKHRGMFWRPKAPSGYVSLGDVATYGMAEPSVTDVWCLREDLVVNAPYQAWAYWYTNAWNISFWEIIPESLGTSGAERVPIRAGTFRANDKTTKPGAEIAYVPALLLPKRLSTFEVEPPSFTKTNIPSSGRQYSNTEQNSVVLPFTAFLPSTDPRSVDKISNPFMKLSRTIAWYVEGVWSNDGGGNYTRSKEITRGVSNTQTNEMSHTAGVNISASYGIKGAEGSISLNYQFTTTNTSSFNEYQEQKVTESFEVPAGKATILLTKHVWIRGERLDGSALLSQVEMTTNDDIYFRHADLR